VEEAWEIHAICIKTIDEGGHDRGSGSREAEVCDVQHGAEADAEHAFR
jgi:hypothetical protein